jgi:PAS domain S-box-containing protein
MRKPSDPTLESTRLAALRRHGILDTPPEPELNEIVQLAAYICGVPIALITLVDENRQWFKARVGLAVAETPRDVAFCAHAILTPDDVLIVSDATLDPRFAHNPLVTGDPCIRFYAGVPLLTPERLALGTLCVIDRVPRDLTSDQIQALSILGRQVTTRLELRQKLREEAALMAIQQAVVDNAGCALIATDAAGQITLFNPFAERLLGYRADEMVGLQTPAVFHLDAEVVARAAEFSAQLGIDLEPGFEVFVAKSRRDLPNEHEWTYVRKDGAHVPVSLTISALRGDAGEVHGFLGVANDLSARRQAETDLRQSEVHYQTVVNALSEGIVLQDLNGTIQAANQAAERILGLNLSQLQGRSSFDPRWRTVHEDGTPYPGESHPSMLALKTGRPQSDVVMGVHKADGSLTWLLVNAQPLFHVDRPEVDGVVASFVDITGRKAVERAMRESERFARGAIDGLSAHIAILDRTGAILEVNSGWRRFGEANARIDGDPKRVNLGNYLDICDAATGPSAHDARRMAAGIREVVAGTRPDFTLEYPCHSPQEERWYSAHVTRFQGDGPLRLVVAHADITTEVQTQRMHQQLSERLSLALEAAQVGIWEWDITRNHLVWDDQMFALYGVTPQHDAETYTLWLNGLHPEDRARGDAEIALALDGTKRFDTEFRVLWPDRTVRHIRAIGRVQRDAEGRPTRMLGTNWDITDRKHIEELLLASETRARAVIEAVADSIIVSDEFGVIQTCNSATERIFGYSSEALLGKHIECLVPMGYPATHGPRKADPGALGSRELSGRRSDGSGFPIDLAVSRTLVGDQPLFIGLVRDITARKQAEADLRQAKELADAAREAADEANRAKSDFLANMSHELRTPLNGVIGMTHLIGKTALDAEQRRFVETARISGETLLALIDNILDFSKVEAGKLELESTAFSLPALMANLAAVLEEQARGKSVGLHFVVEPEVPVALKGDPVRLNQVLTNLASNAVKFTATGEVTVRCELYASCGSSPEAPGVAQLLFTVRDTGIGLSAEQITRLFVPFSQADSSTTRQYGGTGLGLAIVKRLVDCMGGTFGVESELGSGSCFWFAIALPTDDPTGVVVPAPSPVAVAAPRTGGPLLVAEDNPINQQVICAILEMYGYDVDVVANGAEAVAALERREYALVLMDAQMPDMDGVTATRRIRHREAAQAGGRHTVIVALTANALKGAREEYLAAGMDDYLSKPVTPDDLEAVLARWLPPAAATEAIDGDQSFDRAGS